MGRGRRVGPESINRYGHVVVAGDEDIPKKVDIVEVRLE